MGGERAGVAPHCAVDNHDLIERYLADAESYRGLTRGRIVRCRRVLSAFAAELDGPLGDATALDLRGFLTTALEDNYSPNTVRQQLGMIRPFYDWGHEAGVFPADTLLNLKRVPAPRGSTSSMQPHPYSRTELAQFWVDLDALYPLLGERERYWVQRWLRGQSGWKRIWTHAMNLQVKAIVSLALDMGLRSNEIRTLAIDDCHADNEYVVVNGKDVRGLGGKEREVPFATNARAAMHEWIECRHVMARKMVLQDAPWVSCYPNSPGHSILPVSWALLAGRIGPYTLHRFRHTFATERLRAGVPLEAVSRLLGHSNHQTTLCYAEIARPDLKRHMDRSDARFDAAVRSTAR